MKRWSAEEDAFLSRAAAGGFSAAYIGRVLGRSRDSVLGRAMRLDIVLKAVPRFEKHTSKERGRSKHKRAVRDFMKWREARS